MRTKTSVIAIILLLVASACDNTGPTKSNNSDRPLAGGGRFANDDPAEGYPDSSGIEYPVIYPGDGVYPIYSSHIDCENSPGNRIIEDSAGWKAWWDVTTGCQWRGGMGPDGTMDSNWVPGDTSNPCGGRCETDPPYVDFEQFVVAAIKIEYDSGSFCYRSVWVTDIQEVEGNTTIYYEVSKLDQTCCDMIMAMFIPMGTSPVEAVLIQRPLAGQVAWVRTNTTQDCQGPDPNEPMTLHYTDAPCALGNGEEVITDSAAWDAWFHTAWACDSARFGYFPYDDPMRWDSSWIGPNGDTVPPWPDSTIYNPYPWWGAPYVDFSTHAVIILRSGEQTHWGGGIWLDDIDRSSGGTTFDYTVMLPSDDCPHMGDMGMMSMTSNPTVAIRVPLPIDPPVIWHRQHESINCDWGSDTTVVEPWPWPGRDSM